MNDWFENLEQRERLFVIAGAAAIVLALLYFLVWSPVAKRHADVAADVEIWRTSLAEIRPLRAQLSNGADSNNGASPGVPSANRSPIIIVDQTLRERGLDQYRKRSQPTSSNGIRIEFENVSFDELVVWLGDLSANHAMFVQAATFSRGAQDASGRVKANLTLERSL